MRNSLLLISLNLAGLVHIAASQSCFYPNGQESNDFPCSSDSGGVMCCPFQWQCLDNGLCYNPVADIMGRYTCTDQNWESPGCPGFCKDSDSVIGDEAVLVCNDGRYCCDRNRLVGNCCDWPASNETFFTRNTGNVFATVVSSGVAKPTTFPGPKVPPLQGETPTPTPTPSSPPSTQSSSPPSTSDSPPSTTKSPKPTGDGSETYTSTMVSIASGSDGPRTVTITTVFTVTPTSDPTSTPSGKSNKHTSVIAGVAIGIPVGIALIGAALFIFCRRRRDKTPAPSIGSDSTMEEARPRVSRRFSSLSGMFAKSSPDDSVSDPMLNGNGNVSEEKLGDAILPVGAVGPPAEVAERYKRPRPPSGDGYTRQPLRVHIPGDNDRIGLVSDNQPPMVTSPSGYAPQRRNSWNNNQVSPYAVSPYSPLTGQPSLSPTTFWRNSGDSDNGWGGTWMAPSIPNLETYGPGGLSPVVEEPAYDFDAPLPPRAPGTTPGGRHIPIRPPSGIITLGRPLSQTYPSY